VSDTTESGTPQQVLTRPFSHRRPLRPGGLTAIRVVFGLVWAIDAAFKWAPAFQAQFLSDVTSAEDGQPGPVKAWIRVWVTLLKSNPHLFCYLLAIAETLLAIALIFGIFTRLACVLGALLSLIIWSTAEGFGGPYRLGMSTDIGTSIIYVLVFAALYPSRAASAVDTNASGPPRVLLRWISHLRSKAESAPSSL
jgi:thiosulfate dehydrogenase (quinone) large subunit